MSIGIISGRERALDKLLWACETLKATSDAEERAEYCNWAAKVNTALETVVLQRQDAADAAEVKEAAAGAQSH